MSWRKQKLASALQVGVLMGHTSFWKGSGSPMEVKSKFTQRSASRLNLFNIITNSGPIRRKKHLYLFNLNITMCYWYDMNTWRSKRDSRRFQVNIDHNLVSANVTIIFRVMQLLCRPSAIPTSQNGITEVKIQGWVTKMVKSFEKITQKDAEMSSTVCLRKGLQRMAHDKSTSNKETYQ